MFYSNFFGVSIPRTPLDLNVARSGPLLNNLEQAALVYPVDAIEIQEALFSIGNDKAPVPDGYPAPLFKKNWDEIGNDVISVVSEFFTKGLILRELNQPHFHLPYSQKGP